MEMVEYRIPVRDGEPIVVAPLGDIQWAGVDGPTAQETLRRHLARTLALKAWYVGCGDYIDFMSPSNRERLGNANLYDTASDVIDKTARDLVHELVKEHLAPTKGRWCGLLHGHHYMNLRNGQTTDTLLAQLLSTRFLGTSAFVRLALTHGQRVVASVTIWAHHGTGGGILPGSPLNKLYHLAQTMDADLIIMGHTTKQSTAPIQRIEPTWGRTPGLEHREIRLVNAGGFARSYVLGSRQGSVPMGQYPEVGMMAPAALGAPIIRITPTLERDGRRKVWRRSITVEV